MNAIARWEAVERALAAGGRVCLLAVVDRRGSAPNGPGSMLVLTDRGERVGTIGGGASEFQMVADAEAHFATGGPPATFTLNHFECAPEPSSGMICGGSQTYVRLWLAGPDLPAVRRALAAERAQCPARLVLSARGLAVEAALSARAPCLWEQKEEGDWRFEETIGQRERLTIIGGGHVGLALSCVAAGVDFHVTVLDNRHDLGTLAANAAAHVTRVIDYADVAAHVPEGARSYVCIMTYGFRPDRDVLRQLIHKPLRYLGMLGSIRKVRAVFAELEAEGISKMALARVHAPLGVPIGSRTPEEIAISITADLIRARRSGEAL